jgi:hypothetical protein
MRINVLVCSFFSAILVVTLSHAGQDKWKLYTTEETSRGFIYEYYYDSESITRPSKSLVRLWQMFKKKDRSNNLLRKGISFEEFDCIKKTVTKMENIVTFENGELTYTYLDPGGKQTIKPKSSSEELYSVLCEDRGKKVRTRIKQQ